MKYATLTALLIFTIICRSQTDTWNNYTHKKGITFGFQDGNELNIINSGIRVFDSTGNTLREFNSGNSDIVTEAIHCGIADSNGVKWYGTPYGVGRFYQNSWQVFDTSNSNIVSNDVLAVTIDRDGNKWFGTDIGISKFDGVNWTNYNTFATFGFNYPVMSLAVDTANILWVVYDYAVGAAKFDGTTWTFYNPTATGITFPSLEKVVADPTDGSVWFFHSTEMIKRDHNNVWSKYPHGQISDFDIDNSGTKWILNYDTLYKFDDVTWTTYSTPINYSAPLMKIFADDFGNKWVGSDLYPMLIKFDGNSWTEIDYYGIASNKVYEIEQDSAGIFWIATEQGLQKFDGAHWTTFNTSNSALLSNSVKCIEFDQQGNLWCAANKILYRLIGNTWSSYQLNTLSNSYISDIAIDATGNKWCSVTNGNVSKLNISGFWTDYSYTAGGGYVTPPNTSTANCIEIDSQNNIWIGTDKGIAKYNGTSSTFYTPSNSALGGLDVKALEIDHQGNIWAGHNSSGISKFNGSNWISYNSTNSSLPNLVTDVRGLVADPFGNIWIIPNYWTFGIHRFDGTNTNSYYMPFYYQTVVGQAPPFVDKNGRKWFVGNGLSVLTDGESNIVETDESLITGKVFYDKNTNGAKDSNENYLQGIQVHVDPTNATGFTSASGEYKIAADTGVAYTINIPTQGFWYPTTSAINLVLHDSDLNVQDLGVNAIDTNIILTNISAVSNRCNSIAPIWFNYTNTGTLADSGTIVLTVDSSVIVITSVPAYDSLNGNKVFYHFNTLSPGSNLQVRLNVQLPDFTLMGHPLIYTSELTTTDSEIYRDTASFILTCAYDPNIKEISPPGYRSPNFLLKNQDLQYTIHFQNTGNDTAYDVRITDSLSQYLDWTTLRVSASSHNVNTTLNPNGTINFNFYSIMLPDSTRDELMSHGFVSYNIKCLPTIPEGAIVKNTAHIFFDFNPAVTTNTTSNCIVDAFEKNGTVNHILCPGDSISLNGIYQNSPGTIIDTVLSVLGLDSLIAHIITPTNNPLVTASVSPLSTGYCEGDLIVLNGNGATTYAWSGGVINGLAFELDSVSTYEVIGTDTNGCRDTAYMNIHINSLPIIQFTPFPDSLCFLSPTLTLNYTPTGGSFNGQAVIGNMFDPNESNYGWNAFTYMYTDTNSCYASTTDSIYVSHVCSAVNIGSAHIDDCLTVGPNPTTGVLNISSVVSLNDVSIVIYDMLGKKVMETKLSPEKNINISTLAQGMYLLEIGRNQKYFRHIIKN